MNTQKDEILHIVQECWNARSLFSGIGKAGNPVYKGLTGSLRALFILLCNKHLHRPMIVVVPEISDAELLTDELAAMSGRNTEAACFSGEIERDNIRGIVSPRRTGQHMQILRGLLSKEIQLVVTEPQGLCQKLPPPLVLKDQIFSLETGIETDLYGLMDRLIDYGYDRESMVERAGEVSLRGGILDIFPYTGEAPHRIEFNGNTIESIRTFDTNTQRSTGSRQSLAIIPTPLAWHRRTESLLSYFPDPPAVFIEDQDLVLAHISHFHERNPEEAFGPDTLMELISRQPWIRYASFASPANVLDIGGRGVEKLGRLSSEIRERLHALTDTGNHVYIVCENHEQHKRIRDLFDLDENAIPNLHVTLSQIQRGFTLPSEKLIVYSVAELFGSQRARRRAQKFHAGVPLRELSALSRGDFVVHVDYGIGVYEGLQRISIKGTERECLTLQYKDGDKLYVPLDKIDHVYKYSARDGACPELSKLGGNRWESIKRRTKKSIMDIASDLIHLYSERQAKPGFSFSKDTAWQKELDASFIYEETPDQATAIADVRRDMESERPMDRLVCGDVGYGKTEVAIRAAFKAVNDSKQVAVLVPTTILAEQHFRTFNERLGGYPIEIQVLSRFRNRNEQKRIVEKLKAGETDIVIGTHRLLSRDVVFKDLGLLIIDEEHRFGVSHKEQLKKLRTQVDVMALSATPIPRTLHLSLVGIRDMSLITTPPKDRLPIMTEVVPFHEDVIVHAIEKELERGGQIFFVHNRIRSIYGVAGMIRRLVPGIRLCVAHGRMDEKALEKVMLEFMEKKYDCLVSTLIIGSGVDIPNVNTLIVNRADQLGLAQLYQLRGRVGRSGRRAYAYLLTPPLHILTGEAIKRLRTIEEFTELGSGFQIASRDLEIRGTGNLLGVEQSGYIDAVGFDLYNRLVEEAVREIKDGRGGELPEAMLEDVECYIEVDAPALLPVPYVEDESVRVALYRKMAAVTSVEAVDRLEEELKDRFGTLPEETRSLLDVVRIRVMARKHGIYKLVIKGKKLTGFFHEGWENSFAAPELFNQRIRFLIDSSPNPIRFLHEKQLGFTLSFPDGDPVLETKKWLHRWG